MKFLRTARVDEFFEYKKTQISRPFYITFFSRGSQVVRLRVNTNKHSVLPHSGLCQKQKRTSHTVKTGTMSEKRNSTSEASGHESKKPKPEVSSNTADESNIDDDLLAQSELAAATAVAEAEKADSEVETQQGDETSGQEQSDGQSTGIGKAVNEQEEAEGQQEKESGEIGETADQQQAQRLVLHHGLDKPLAGSEEWHRQRKDNHKEVERRRRETINSGIKELSALLPTPETNKSQILQRSIEHIKRLQENEKNNMEKWTLEKLLNDQALTELTAANEKLKNELERAYREVEHWKKIVTIAKTGDK